MSNKFSILSPRWSKVLADLWDNKLRTLLVVASIAVGVFAVGGIATAYDIFSEDVDLSYALKQPPNIEIWTDPFDEDFLGSIESLTGVLDAEGRHIFHVRASQDGETWKGLELVAVDDFEEMQINLLSTAEGASRPEEREMLVIRDTMNDTGYHVGDVLQVQLPDDSIRTIPVVGVSKDQTIEFGPMGSPRGYITLDTLEWLGQPDYYNRLFVRVSGDSNDEAVIQAATDAVEDQIKKSGRNVYRTQLNKTNEHPMGDLTRAILGVLALLGGLILLLSSSLIVNTLNALLAQHMRQIGVMKLVGARSQQVLGMYLVLILAFGLIASVIAVPLGALAGNAFAAFIADFMNVELQGYRIIPYAIVLQILVAVLVPLGAGFFPVRSGSKTKVRRAISNDRPGDQPTSSGWLDRLGERARWISRPVLLSIRNTFRRKGRLMLTLFTLTMAGAIFIAVFNVRSSMEGYMDQLGKYYMADITLDFDRPYRISKVEEAVFEVPGVIDMEAWSGAPAEILDEDDNVVKNVQIIAPPNDSTVIEPEVEVGRWLLPGEERAIVLSDAVWGTYPDIKPGDTLRLSVLGGREEDWVVVGIFSFTSMINDILGYANYDYISDLLNMNDQASSYRLTLGQNSLADQENIGAALDQHMQDRGFRVGDVEAGLVTRASTSEAIDILIIFLLIMALLTAFVGSIGLTGTMGMNVLERTREIGVMRAIGAVDLKIMNSVIVEGVLIGMISWVLAVIASFPISYLLLRVIGQAMFNAPINPIFTLRGLFIWLLVVLVLAVLASVLPARNAARLTIREVLAYE